MATRLMLSLKKAADKSGLTTHTEDSEQTVTDVVFVDQDHDRNHHVTMEYAMESGLSRRDRDQTQTISFELGNLP